MHRDISPDNILVYENGSKFKICDFGFASSDNKSLMFCGKDYFMPPEIDNL